MTLQQTTTRMKTNGDETQVSATGSQRASAGTPQLYLCPYCGLEQTDPQACQGCSGLFEPLSRQATQNAMGAWYLRDPSKPFMPGCSYETLAKMATKGKILPETVLRGPTTRQFWTYAKHAPGVGHLLGACHNCGTSAGPDEYMCGSCKAVFHVAHDRHSLGLAAPRPLPGSGQPYIAAPTHPSPPPADAQEAVEPMPARVESRPRDSESAPAMRVLRSQVRSLRLASGVLGVAALVFAGITTVLLINRPGASEGPSGVALDPAAKPTSADTRNIDPVPSTDPAEALGEQLAQGLDSAPEAVDPDLLAAREHWKSEVALALGMSEADTIEAVEQAIAKLNEIKAAAPAEAIPDDFEEVLDRLNDRLDTLNLRKFL